jgi:hypothetical protein
MPPVDTRKPENKRREHTVEFPLRAQQPANKEEEREGE